MTSNKQEIKVLLPDKVKELWNPYRHKVLYGGRGSAKTESVARILLVKSTQSPIRILCTRETQTSIKQSVHGTLRKCIKELGIEKYFTITDVSIKVSNGSEFIFAGLNNDTIESIKSIAGINHCWVEEASSISQRSFDLLIPSIREEGSEIWWTFNRYKDEDPVTNAFVLSQPPENSVVIQMNYWDNPFFPEVLKLEMLADKARDYQKYKHIWEGYPVSHSFSCIFKDYFTSYTFTPNPDTWNPLFGCDLGFANDPTVLLKCWEYENTLYIEKELYELGLDVDIMPDYFSNFDKDIKNRLIYTDCSRPETISYMRRHGFPRCVSVPKWSGSIEDGIEVLKSFHNIVVHPNCPRTLYDLSNYSYKIDKLTNAVVPIIVDKYSDCIDAMRYAITPIIKGYKLKTIPGREPEPTLNALGQVIRNNAPDAYTRQQRIATRLGNNAWMF